VYLLEYLSQAEDYAFWFAVDKQAPVDIWSVQVEDLALLKPDTHRDMAGDFNSWICGQAIKCEALKLVKMLSIPRSRADAPPFAQRFEGGLSALTHG